MPTTTVRLPLRVEQALAEYCVETKKTKSEVIVDLLEQRFAQPTQGKTPYELAVEVGFIGCFGDQGEAATGNYKERVKAAIRAKHKR